MGLKKIVKSIKKAFKKVAKATGLDKAVRKVGGWVKGAVKSFGKFMGKIGVVGQIAMMFILPGIGSALMSGFSAMAGWGAGMVSAGAATGGVMGALQAGVGHMAQFVGQAVTTAGNVFSNVTKGITDTLGNFADTLGSKMGFNTGGAENFFSSGGADSAWNRSFGESSRFQNLTMDPTKAGKLAETAGQIAEEATVNGVTLPEAGVADPLTGQTTPITQAQIKQEALGQLAQDELVADMAAEKALEEAAMRNITDPSLLADPSATVSLPTDAAMTSAQFSPVPAVDPITGAPVNTAFSPVPQPVDPLATVSAPEPSFLEKVTDFGKGVYEKGKQKVLEAPERMIESTIDAAVGGPETAIRTAAQEYGLEAVHGEGFRQAPATEVAYHTTVVPAIEAPISSTQVQAPEVADYRNFASSISTNPNPYGNTAYQYQVGYQQYRQGLTA